MHGIEFLQTDPHFIPILKQNNDNNYNYNNLLPVDSLLFTGTRTDSASAAFTREQWGEKDFVSSQ